MFLHAALPDQSGRKMRMLAWEMGWELLAIIEKSRAWESLSKWLWHSADTDSLQRLLPPSQEIARLIQEVCKWLSDHPMMMADVCLTPATVQVWQTGGRRSSAQPFCHISVLNIWCMMFPFCDKSLWETRCCYFSIAACSVSPCTF